VQVKRFSHPGDRTRCGEAETDGACCCMAGGPAAQRGRPGRNSPVIFFRKEGAQCP